MDLTAEAQRTQSIVSALSDLSSQKIRKKIKTPLRPSRLCGEYNIINGIPAKPSNKQQTTHNARSEAANKQHTTHNIRGEAANKQQTIDNSHQRSWLTSN